MIVNANALHIPLADGSVHTIVTSPPYYGLRDYGTAKWQGGDEGCDHLPPNQPGPNAVVGNTTSLLGRTPYKNVCGKCGAIRIDAQIGLEVTPDAYIANLVEVFRECKRILRDDGTLWVNIGDSYFSDTKGTGGPSQKQDSNAGSRYNPIKLERTNGVKPKDLIGIPWMLAFALRADGWYLRQDIIWCLSGGAFVYVKTQKGVMPMMVKDVARLDPSTVKLWNGDKWTQLLGVSKSERRGDELEIVLRSGERISCTPSHKFPTTRGLLTASELIAGDILMSTTLPDVENPRDCVLDEDAAWFAGLYIAEGSRAHGCIQIAGHSRETERWERCNRIAKKFGGYATLTVDGNNQAIRMYGKVLNAILDELVSGTYASDKCFATVTWRYSNKFIASMLDGYLSGDGHWEAENNRWRFGFTRNYNLERDLRTACARLGYRLILNMSTVPYKGKDVPTFRGELRKERSTHHNNKNANEVMEIRKARCRYVYDLGVADEPHLFALASGILTHNSKPNPMPESVKDRCTKAHEYIFLLTKSARYYYDADAIREPYAPASLPRALRGVSEDNKWQAGAPGSTAHTMSQPRENRRKEWEKEHGGGGSGFAGHSGYVDANGRLLVNPAGRNKRSVWTVTTKPYKGAHYATFPPDLIKPMILAGCPPGGIVLDPFAGSGTTVMVAIQLGREGIGLDLSASYLHEQAKKRIATVQGVLV